MSFFDTTWYLNYGNGSNTGYYAVAQWAASTPYTAGTIIRQLATPAVGSERLFVCYLTVGLSSATEPSWGITRGAQTIDTSVRWQECTGLAGINGDLINCPIWVASRVLTLGSMLYDSTSGSLQILTTAGTSTTTKPTFSATAGVTTTDGTCIWTSIGPTSNFTSTPWLYPHARKQAVQTTTWMAAGNTCYVGSNHDETQSTAMTLPSGSATSALPFKFICTPTSSAPPTSTATTATITTTGNSAISESASQYIYGINYSCSTGTTQAVLQISSSQTTIAENCTFLLGSTGSGNLMAIGFNGSSSNFFSGCSFNFGAVGQSLSFGELFGVNPVKVIFQSCTFAATGSVPTTLIQLGSQITGQYILRDCDLSNLGSSSTIINCGSPFLGDLYLENCKLGSAVIISSGSNSQSINTGFVHVHNCDSSATNYRYYFANPAQGTIQQETTIVRMGGATDGVTPISWHCTTTSNPTYYTPLYSEEISSRNTIVGTSITATIYLTSNTTLDNSKIWLEIEYPSSTSFPLGAIVTTRMTVIGTPVALTSDTSTWGGSALTNKYSITTPSFTPQMVGPIKARIYVAVPSATIYVDPLLVL